jgi:hypothetical protein
LIFGAAYLAQRATVTILSRIRPVQGDPSLAFMVFFQISGPLMLLGGSPSCRSAPRRSRCPISPGP